MLRLCELLDDGLLLEVGFFRLIVFFSQTSVFDTKVPDPIFLEFSEILEVFDQLFQTLSTVLLFNNFINSKCNGHVLLD
jgi:hypothetical protein